MDRDLSWREEPVVAGDDSVKHVWFSHSRGVTSVSGVAN